MLLVFIYLFFSLYGRCNADTFSHKLIYRLILLLTLQSGTFSNAAGGRHRNFDNIDGHSEEAEAANQMIKDMIFVLKYYKDLNPDTLFVIENPDCYLQHTNCAKEFKEKLGLEMRTVSYCMLSPLYGGSEKLPQKHTCIWTNSKNLLHVCRDNALKCKNDCHARGGNGRHLVQVQGKDDRYARYPEAFVSLLLTNLLPELNIIKRGKAN